MSSLPVSRPTQLDLLYPPVSDLIQVNTKPSDANELGAFVSATRAWSQLQVRLSTPISCALWVIFGASAAVGGWLTAVLAGASECSGALCTIATLGDRTHLLVGLAGCCIATLLGVATTTRGLTRASAQELVMITVAVIAGVVSVLGVVAVLALAALGAALILLTFVVLFECAR